MESAERLTKLFTYDQWANKQVWLALKKHRAFPDAGQAYRYFAHVAGSQEIWYRRIENQSTDNLEIWPDYELSEAFQIIEKNHPLWIQLIEQNVDNLARSISYNNSKGEAFNTELADILHHIVIHGQHHRAQIAFLLRNAKIPPPVTDFIFFSRLN